MSTAAAVLALIAFFAVICEPGIRDHLAARREAKRRTPRARWDR
jgi:hypothetical protein